jgi:hypothetical protein
MMSWRVSAIVAVEDGGRLTNALLAYFVPVVNRSFRLHYSSEVSKIVFLYTLRQILGRPPNPWPDVTNIQKLILP